MCKDGNIRSDYYEGSLTVKEAKEYVKSYNSPLKNL